MFCFVIFQKFWLPTGLHNSAVSAQRPVEHLKNDLQNITTVYVLLMYEVCIEAELFFNLLSPLLAFIRAGGRMTTY